MHDNKSRSGGFTLIELLVVIAVIGMIAAIIIAAVSKVRASARDAKRIAEIKQIENAINMWQNDESYIPDPRGDAVDNNTNTDNISGGVPCNTTKTIQGLGAGKCIAMKSNADSFFGSQSSQFNTKGILTRKIKDPLDPACFMLYVTDGEYYEVMVPLERDIHKMENDGGNEPLAYERGSNVNLAGMWSDLNVIPQANCMGSGSSGGGANVLTGSCTINNGNACVEDNIVPITWNSNDTDLKLDCGNGTFNQPGSGSLSILICNAPSRTCTFTSITGKTGSFQCSVTRNDSPPITISSVSYNLPDITVYWSNSGNNGATIHICDSQYIVPSLSEGACLAGEEVISSSHDDTSPTDLLYLGSPTPIYIFACDQNSCSKSTKYPP